MSKAVREVMRGQDRFHALKELHAAVMARQGMDAEDAVLAAIVRKRNGATLRNLKRRGQAEDRHGVGLAMEWRLGGD